MRPTRPRPQPSAAGITSRGGGAYLDPWSADLAHVSAGRRPRVSDSRGCETADRRRSGGAAARSARAQGRYPGGPCPWPPFASRSCRVSAPSAWMSARFSETGCAALGPLRGLEGRPPPPSEPAADRQDVVRVPIQVSRSPCTIGRTSSRRPRRDRPAAAHVNLDLFTDQSSAEGVVQLRLQHQALAQGLYGRRIPCWPPRPVLFAPRGAEGARYRGLLNRSREAVGRTHIQAGQGGR